MRRKTRRQGQKKWVAFLTPMGVITTLVVLLFNSFKDTFAPRLLDLINIKFSLEKGSSLPLLILFFFALLIIAIISYFVSRFYLSYHKPNKKYFELIDFGKPTDDIIRKAVEGILNSEKTQPYFVHVAPVNDEIGQFYERLDTKGFVWENGRPGDGKSMLAYHALYRYRKKIEIRYRYILVAVFEIKFRVYKLNLNHISEEKEIDAILAELDSLRGGSRKIILIDDAHKLKFEDTLRFQFEEEAEEKVNGKFVWVNTNYLEGNRADVNDSINIDFEKFYPKLLSEFYKSQNPIVKEIIKTKCTGLQNAIERKEDGRIKDAWHFNFVASNGEHRIFHLLEKLSVNKEEQDTLLLAIYLFSVRYIVTGEKEINQTEFANLLAGISVPYFKKGIEAYQTNNIISDLASQDKGRFLIIENKDILDRGFLHAPHYRLSIAIVKSVTTRFSDENLIKQIIDISKIFLTSDYAENKYFSSYFNSLGKYQGYFLKENGLWIKGYLTDLVLDQLHVYSNLLSILKRSHSAFYEDLLTEEYFHIIAPKISLASSKGFQSIQELILAFGTHKQKLISCLDWDTLALTANKTDVAQLTQVANLLIALGTTNEKHKLVAKLDLVTLAKTANMAEVKQLSQVADIVTALGSEEDKQKFIHQLDFDALAKAANNAKVSQLKQVAEIIMALETDKDKQKLIEKLDFDTLTGTANIAEVKHLSQVADIIMALGVDQEKQKLIGKLDWDAIAQTANKAEVSQFAQLESMLTALRTEKEKAKLIDKFDFDSLATATNNADVAQLSQVADFITALGAEEKKQKLIDKLDFAALAGTANKAEVSQFKQVAELIIAMGTDKEKHKLIAQFDLEALARTANNAEVTQFKQVADFIVALSADKEKQNFIDQLDLETLAKTANKADVAKITQVAEFVLALGTKKEKFSFLLDIEIIINYSRTINSSQIASFCMIISSLVAERQNTLIGRIDWITILKKIRISHSIHIRHLSNVLAYQCIKQEAHVQPAEKDMVNEYLISNQDKIVKFATQYFDCPDDFQFTAKLLEGIIPFNFEIAHHIVEILKSKIIFKFQISPKYFLGFSSLLSAIHKISPKTSYLIVGNKIVFDKLVISFQNDDLNERIEGLQILLQTINSISSDKYKEICELEPIRKLELINITEERKSSDSA